MFGSNGGRGKRDEEKAAKKLGHYIGDVRSDTGTICTVSGGRGGDKGYGGVPYKISGVKVKA